MASANPIINKKSAPQETVGVYSDFKGIFDFGLVSLLFFS
jgi:hypothetical protein